jgi:hypothetical protein
MSPEENNRPVTCASCGGTVNDKFCGHCGEKVLNVHDKSILHFFEEFIHILTHADSKFLKSLRYLFTKPGYLTAEYLKGSRKRYASPLSIFFIGNLLYILLAPVDALNSHYKTQVEGQMYSSSIKHIGEKKMADRHWTREEMEEHYNHKSTSISKMMMVVLIFLFSVPAALLFYRRDRYYFDHLAFATEFINYIMYVVLLALPYTLYLLIILIYYIFHVELSPDLNSNGAILFLLGILWLYIYTAARRVYKQRIILPQTILLTVCSVAMVVVYRFLLFNVTIWML